MGQVVTQLFEVLPTQHLRFARIGTASHAENCTSRGEYKAKCILLVRGLATAFAVLSLDGAPAYCQHHSPRAAMGGVVRRCPTFPHDRLFVLVAPAA